MQFLQAVPLSLDVSGNWFGLAAAGVTAVGWVAREVVARRRGSNRKKVVGLTEHEVEDKIRLMQLEACQDCRMIGRVEQHIAEMKQDLSNQITAVAKSVDDLKNLLIDGKVRR